MVEETHKAIKGKTTNHSQKQKVNTEILNDLNLIEKGKTKSFSRRS